MKVGVLGAGAYGAAMAGVLRQNGHGVKFFDPVKLPSVSLYDVLEYAQVVLLAVPAKTVRMLLGDFPAETFLKPVIVTTKGVMDISVWEQFRYFEIVSGPGFADEIRKQRRTKLTVTARRALEGKTLSEDLLGNSYMKFDKTEDIIGVMMLSGLKNIYAIEAGRRGLKKGSEEFNDFITDTYRESEKFLLYNGGFVETARLSAGLGDLVLTCGGEASRNYQFGRLMKHAKKETTELKKFIKNNTIEGLFACQEIIYNGFTIPKENEILLDIMRRLKDVTKR